MIKLAIFASGGGSNAAKIIEYFVTHKTVEISIIVCNKANAGVTEIASKNNIPSRVVSKLDLSDPVFITDLEKKGIAYIVLAGFLLQIPALLIKHFPAKIINIHPALLPKKISFAIRYKHQRTLQNTGVLTAILLLQFLRQL